MHHGVRVVGVTPQTAAVAAAYVAEHPLPFPLLSDSGRDVVRAYGVNHPFGLDFSLRTARPSVFLVDRNGVIRFIYVGSHKWDRPDLEGLMQAAANLAGTD